MKYLFFPKYIYDTIENEQIYWMKPIFYNAKKGQIALFDINEYPETKRYIKIKITKNLNWDFDVSGFWGHNYMFYENFIDYKYNEKYNETVDKLPNLKPEYPTGDLFDYETQTYKKIEDNT